MAEFEHSVEVETDRPVMPNFCVCCGDPATEQHRPEQPGRMRGMPMPDEPLAFPYCSPCEAHLRASQDRRTANLVALNLAIWGVGLPLAAGLPLFAIIPGPLIAAYLYWKNQGKNLTASGNCTAEGDAAKATWVRKQTYRFTFSRKETAQAFLDLNRDDLTAR